MAAKPASSATQSPPPPSRKRPAPADPPQQQEKRAQQILSFPIQLSDQISQTVKEAKIFKSECSEIGKRATRILRLLRTAARLSTSVSSFYDRPLRRIADAASPNLQKSLTLVRKCRRRGLFRRLFTIVSAAEFRKLISLLDSFAADMDWVLGILEAGDGPTLTLPPIASTDPIISWVWSFVASLHTGQSQEKTESANRLASLAEDNDRNKQIIVEEGGISPLLKMLKDNSSLDGQIVAASALCSLAKNAESTRAIIDASGVSIIVQVLSNSQAEVQIRVGNLIAEMAEHCPFSKEDLGRENVIRPLVMLLSSGVPMDASDQFNFRKESICYIVHKEMETSNLTKSEFGSSNLTSHYKKKIEIEDPEVRLALETSCAQALRMLAKNSVVNSRRIAETKGLLCLAKLVETQKGQLKYNCLMTIMEIAAAAESDTDFRRVAFKTNSRAAKATIDQLLEIIKDSDDCDQRLSVVAIKAIGCLGRTFPAKESTKLTIIGPLVQRLRDKNRGVAIEAAISLGKFACTENFLCVEHSRSIIECGGVYPLVELLRGGERVQVDGLALICYLAIHAGKSEDLEPAEVRGVLEGVDRAIIARHPQLRESVSKAIYHLSVFHQSL